MTLISAIADIVSAEQARERGEISEAEARCLIDGAWERHEDYTRLIERLPRQPMPSGVFLKEELEGTMDFQLFSKRAEQYLLATPAWRHTGHNGLWPMFVGFGQHLPLPGALLEQLVHSVDFEPVVEQYLIDSGWRRASAPVLVSCRGAGKSFAKGSPGSRDYVVKPLRAALLEQLRIDVVRARTNPHS